MKMLAPTHVAARPRFALLLALVAIFTLTPRSAAAVTPVSHWRMGDDDPGVAVGAAATTTDPTGGRTMTLFSGSFYDSGVSTSAAIHTGSGWCMLFFYGTYATNSLIPSLTDNFGIELWVKPDDTTGTKCLAYNGNSATSGWGLYQIGATYQGLFGGVDFVGAGSVTAGLWTHLALVRDNGTATLYADGVAVGSTSAATPNPPSGQFAVAAQPQNPANELFGGYIDEVRVFTFATGTFSTNDLLLNHPVFTNVPIAGLAGLVNGSAAWADHDNDGRLDFLLTGHNGASGSSQLWRNTGSTFTNVAIANLLGFYAGSAAWGDYDNDGRLDFIVTGATNSTTYFSQVWRNTGSTFTNVPIAGLPGVVNSSVEWGDYDNDGRQDFLLTGYNGSTRVSQLWRNTGSTFTNVPIAGLPGVADSSVAWGDYDNDGRLDFLVTGQDNNPATVSQLWRNTGITFASVSITGLPGVESGSVAWGDYDNDGRLDFLLTGFSTNGRVSQVWRNTGSTFTNVPIPSLPGIDFGSVAWGDYDNDGRLDFLIAGRNVQTAGISQLWRNTGSTFVNVPIAGLPGVYFCSVAWADYDNDGRLDFLLTGNNGSTGVSQLWRNQILTANSAPAAPSGLTRLVSTNGDWLSWNAATDTKTPSSGLTYNVRAGTIPGGTNLLAGHAATTGFRRVPALGNAQMRQFLPLTGLANGQTVYWSVQAVDTAFAGGPFAAESSFTITPPSLTIARAGTSATIAWTPPTLGWILQESLSLAPIAWSNSGSGSTNPITVPATSPTRFYRLFNP